MANKIFFTASVIMLLVLGACNQKKSEPSTMTAPVTEEAGVAVKLEQLASNKDLVCGMPLEEGAIADTTSYEGKVYGFCASECKAEFSKNPQSYLAQK